MDSTWDQFISNSSGWRAYRNCMHSRSPPGQTIQPLADELWYMESWLHTMCDFHNFGLIFVGQMHCLPQRLKSTLFEIFSNGGCPKGTRSVEKISNNVDFSLWGNRATTWEYFLTFSSETKIMKIRHSALGQSILIPMLALEEGVCWI